MPRQAVACRITCCSGWRWQASGWIVSETTSPIDYSPIATATTASRNLTDGAPIQLSIRCRGGRTELALSGKAITGRGDNYHLSYRVNGDQPVQLAGCRRHLAIGVAFKGDVVALLQQLPGDGELAVRLIPLSGSELDGIFSLNGLETAAGKDRRDLQMAARHRQARRPIINVVVFKGR